VLSSRAERFSKKSTSSSSQDYRPGGSSNECCLINLREDGLPNIINSDLFGEHSQEELKWP